MDTKSLNILLQAFNKSVQEVNNKDLLQMGDHKIEQFQEQVFKKYLTRLLAAGMYIGGAKAYDLDVIPITEKDADLYSKRVANNSDFVKEHKSNLGIDTLISDIAKNEKKKSAFQEISDWHEFEEDEDVFKKEAEIIKLERTFFQEDYFLAKIKPYFVLKSKDRLREGIYCNLTERGSQDSDILVHFNDGCVWDDNPSQLYQNLLFLGSVVDFKECIQQFLDSLGHLRDGFKPKGIKPLKELIKIQLKLFNF